MMTILVVISERNPNRHRPKRKEVNMEAFLVSVKERGIDILMHLFPTPYVIYLMGELPLMLNDYVFRKEKGSLVAEN